MKKYLLATGIYAMAALTLPACGDKDGKKDAHQETTYTTPTTPADQSYQTPVEVSADTDLQKGLTEVLKDFPGVQATANKGEVTLTGEVSRDRLPKLMQSVQALKPSKVNNQLQVK